MKHDEVNILIDDIVRQTVVLLAQIATTGGRRAPLARIANKVFMGLSSELSSQGLTQTVSADMFGLALRTYQRKRRRLSGSATETGRSLWEAVFAFVEEERRVARTEILTRFGYDEEQVLRGILRDLVDTGMILQGGRGHSKFYEMAPSPLITQDDDMSIEAAANLLWVSIYRDGPMNLKNLKDKHTSLAQSSLQDLLDSLVKEELVDSQSIEGDIVYSCSEYIIPMGESEGWAASVFDHYQAVVGTITKKLGIGGGAQSKDVVGGSTFAFDIWPGHPCEEEVVGLLAELRPRCQALRAKVDAYNQSADKKANDRVVFYMGQNVFRNEEEDL